MRPAHAPRFRPSHTYPPSHGPNRAATFAALVLAAAAGPGFGQTTVPSGSTGSGQPVSTVQPGLGLNYIVRTTGGTNDSAGTVSLFAGTFAPGGWMFASGQSLNISQNTALFSQIGTTYGGNGTTTFALPNLNGRVAVGDGQGTGLTNRPLGQSFGAATVTLSTAQMPAHSHTVPGGTTGNTGGSTPVSNLQPSLPLRYNIVADGAYPSQSGGTGSGAFIGEVRMSASSFTPSNTATANGQTLSIDDNFSLFSVIGTTYGGNGTDTFRAPDLQGRVPVGAATASPLGQMTGTESTALTTGQLPAHTHTLPGGGTSGSTGNADPIGNRQPQLALNYIIATQGIFPSSSNTDGTFLGRVTLFAGTFTPSGWLPADGRLLNIAQNTALFALLGTTYGGNGTTTFALPDLRGRTAVGAGTGPEFSINLGQVVGTDSITLTTANLPAHTHAVAVPEPGTMLGLAAAGLGLVGGVRRRRAEPV